MLQSFATSQKNLGTSYVDSLVMHSPMRTHADTMKVWRTFEALHQQGLVRQLGISNIYSLAAFKRIFEEATVKPAVVQNRFYEQTGKYNACLFSVVRPPTEPRTRCSHQFRVWPACLGACLRALRVRG